MLTMCDSEQIQVQAHSRLCFIRSVQTSTVPFLSDPTASDPDVGCEVCRVGRCTTLSGRTIKFANSPPCVCRGSTEQKP